MYAQIQRRLESEFSPTKNRPFNQIRSIFFDEQDLLAALSERQSFFGALSFDASRTASDYQQHELLRYQSSRNISEPLKPTLEQLNFAYQEKEFLRFLVNCMLNAMLPVKQQGNSIKPKKRVVVVHRRLEIQEKLWLIDLIQYYVFPFLGGLTFAFDHITNHKIALCLYSSAPETRQEDELIIDYYPNRKLDVGIDYYEILSQSNMHDVLYNPYLSILSRYGLEIAHSLALASLFRDARAPSTKVVAAVKASQKLLPVEIAQQIIEKLEQTEIEELLKDLQIDVNFKTRILITLVHRPGITFDTYFQSYLAIPVQQRNHELHIELEQFLFNYIGTYDLLKSNPTEVYSEIFNNLEETSSNKPQAERKFAILEKLIDNHTQALIDFLITYVEKNSRLNQFMLQAINNKNIRLSPVFIYSIYRPLTKGGFQSYIAVLTHLLLYSNSGQLLLDQEKLKDFISWGKKMTASGLLLENKLPWAEKLRQVCLELSLESIKFADWWLFSELVHQKSALLTDYQKMLDHYRSDPPIDSPFYSLIFAGQTSPEYHSIYEILEKKQANYEAFVIIIQVRLQSGIRVTAEDLMPLIEKFALNPQLVTQIILSIEHQSSFDNLDDNIIMKLFDLSKSKSAYFDSAVTSRLFEILFNREIISDPRLLRLMLFEPFTFTKSGNWKTYSERLNHHLQFITDDMPEFTHLSKFLAYINPDMPISQLEAKLLPRLVISQTENQKYEQVDTDLLHRVCEYLQVPSSGGNPRPLSQLCLNYLENTVFKWTPQMRAEKLSYSLATRIQQIISKKNTHEQ